VYLKERWKGAIVLSLLWVVVTGVMFCFFRDTYPGEIEGSILLSLLLMVLGLIVYLGGYMLLAGFNMMPKEQLARYRMDRITFFMGVFLVLTSLIVFVMTFYFFFGVIFIAAVVIIVIYINISKRFRAETPPR
jgi:hypothetical protein